MPVVIGARYNPYSFEDMLKPLAMAQQEYNAVQEGLSSLTDSSNQFSRYLDGTQAGERVKAYNAAIDTAVNDMAKNGLRSTNRDTLLGLKRQYNNDIAKINQSAAQLDTLYKGVQAAQLKAQASGDTLFVANMPNVDDLLANPSASPIIVSGSGLQKQGMQAAQSASVRNVLNNTKAGQGVMKMYNEIVQGYGYNSAQAQEFIRNAASIPELQQALNTISSMYNVDSLQGSDADRAKQFIMQGILDGMTTQVKSQYLQDPEKMAQMQNEYAIKLAEAQAKAKANAKAGLTGGGTGFLNGRLNVTGVSEEREKFKKYFTEDGKLTQEGWNMYKGVDTIQQQYSPTTGLSVGSSTVHKQDKEFVDFVNNTLKAKGSNGYIKPSNINSAWSAYNSPSSPTYGDTDSYSTIDIPMRATAGNELKKQLAFAYGSDAEVPIVNSIDKKNKKFTTNDTIDMQDLMSDDYNIAKIQASPYAKGVVVNFVSKKGNKNIAVELPMTVIAGEGSAATLQSAFNSLETLEAKPAGSAVSIPGYGIVTKEQAMDMMYAAIQSALLNTMTYYDQEASKEPR